MKSKVRVGNGCGFWGDNLDAPILLAQHGRLDYLTLEYLAELTMSILAQQRQKDPRAGFASDFLDVLERLCPILREQPALKIITNAGGMNPLACAARARLILDNAGLETRGIAVVQGDDLMPHIDDLLARGYSLAHTDTKLPLSRIRPRLVSANAYLGAQPIVLALRQGASLVITGRVADASLTVAPVVHELGWTWDNLDALAAATVAGHLIECGAQVTGGLWCNWERAQDLANVGYPIAEVTSDGEVFITKPPDTGGSVNVETVTEQLLYEIGDPSAYLTPDVVADFTTLKVEQCEQNLVRLYGARGKPAPDSYKVSIAYRDGFMSSGSLVIRGPESRFKARACGEMIRERLRRAGSEPEQLAYELLGAGDCVPGVSRVKADPPEVVLRVAVRDSRREVVERFTRELAPLVTSGPPGVTGYATGRPPVREVLSFWPALVPREAVTPEVIACGDESENPTLSPPTK